MTSSGSGLLSTAFSLPLTWRTQEEQSNHPQKFGEVWEVCLVELIPRLSKIGTSVHSTQHLHTALRDAHLPMCLPMCAVNCATAVSCIDLVTTHQPAWLTAKSLGLFPQFLVLAAFSGSQLAKGFARSLIPRGFRFFRGRALIGMQFIQTILATQDQCTRSPAAIPSDGAVKCGERHTTIEASLDVLSGSGNAADLLLHACWTNEEGITSLFAATCLSSNRMTRLLKVHKVSGSRAPHVQSPLHGFFSRGKSGPHLPAAAHSETSPRCQWRGCRFKQLKLGLRLHDGVHVVNLFGPRVSA